MGTSVLHIKTEIECRVYLFNEYKGIATPDGYFSLEISEGIHDLLLVSTEDTALGVFWQYKNEDNYIESQTIISKTQFVKITAIVSSSMEKSNGVEDEYGVFYSRNGKYLLRCTKNKNLKDYRVKDGCKFICDWAFYGCCLKNIMLPNGLTHIGDGAFYGCIGLSDVGLPISILHVGDVAFDNCLNLHSISLQGAILHWGRSCIWALKSCFIYIPLGQREYFERLLPKDFEKRVKEDSELCPQITSVNQQFSIKEFSKFKGIPTKAGEITVKDSFGEEWKNKGMFFGDQPVVYTSKVLEEHAKQSASEIANDILCHASQYCVERTTFFRTMQDGPVYDIRYSQNTQIEKPKKMNSPGEQSFPEQPQKDIVKLSYLFFDTETSGLPKDDSAPASNTRNWPRLVQLAWILTDKDGNVLSSSSSIIKPDGFTISKEATKIHGIDTAKALREGKPLKNVIEEFLNATKKANYLVGHNISFDQKIVGAELCRLGMKDTISTVKGICTMRSATNYCEIPRGNYYGYKPPKLQELYQKLFGCNFDNAHDAMADVKATSKCFFELKRREVAELMIEEGFALLNPSALNKREAVYSLQEMADRYGKVTIHRDKMRRKDGSEFCLYGLKFGKGPDSLFVQFSSCLFDDDPSKRDSEFWVEIGKKVWSNREQYYIAQEKDEETGELLKRNNGDPILMIYPKV